jgi:hypothetical protein
LLGETISPLEYKCFGVGLSPISAGQSRTSRQLAGLSAAVRISLGVFPVQLLHARVNALTS